MPTYSLPTLPATFSVRSVSAQSSRGGYPDAVANAFLSRFGFVPPRYQAQHRLSEEAVPDVRTQNSYVLKVQDDGRVNQGTFSRRIFPDQAPIEIVSGGRILETQKLNRRREGDPEYKFVLEGRDVTLTIFCCLEVQPATLVVRMPVQQHPPTSECARSRAGRSSSPIPAHS